MIRVLHLFGVQSTFQTEHGVLLLTDPTGQDLRSASLTVGRGGDFRSTLGAAASLRFGHSGFDLIHAWDPQAFIAAVASGLPVVFSPERRFPRGTWSWLATNAYHDVHVVSATRLGCARQVREGLSPERCHVIIPGYEAPARSTVADSELRGRLGISPDQFVILAPGESSRAARHRVAWHAAAILRVLDERFRLLIWGRGPEARLLRDLSVKVKQPQLVVDAERRLGRDVSFDELIGAADVALFTGSSDAAVLPLAACAAAGLPVVATKSALVRETFTTDDLVVVETKDVRTLSQRILEVQENPSRRARLGAAASARARRVFDAASFLKEYAELYQRVAERHGAAVVRRNLIPDSFAAVTGDGRA